MAIILKHGLAVNLPTEATQGEPLYTTDTKKIFIGNGAGQPLTDVLGAGNHTQNTDTGTTSATFAVDSDAGVPVKLKNNAGVLEVRNNADSAYADLKVGNLTVEGTTTTVNSETVTLADNTLELNSNATGAPTENAGIEVNRGASTNSSLIWDESTDSWKAGIKGAEVALVLEGDARLHTAATLGTKTIIETNIGTGKFMFYNGTNIDYTSVIDGGTF